MYVSSYDVIVGGAAGLSGFAIIGLLFNKLKSMANIFYSFFIETLEFNDSDLESAAAHYCINNYKKLKLSKLVYTSLFLMINSINKKKNIIGESIVEESFIFYKNYKFFYFSGQDDWLTISYPRGMFSKNFFIKKIINELKKIKEKKISRFRISRLNGVDGGEKLQITYANEHIKKNKKTSAIGLSIDPINFTYDQMYGDSKKLNYIDKLVFDDSIWKDILDISLWIKSKKWYKDRSIPWKRGWVLYGDPGTGKTSLTRALAEKFDLPIYIIELSTLNDNEFKKGWYEILSDTPCIVLMEDIDSIFNKRENIINKNRNSPGLSFDCLLNCIDGVEGSDGIFTIITTNNINSLDEALIGKFNKTKNTYMCRPGRIDRVIKLGYINKKNRIIMAKRILKNNIKKIVDNNSKLTPAQFQSICEKEALKRFWNLKNGLEK